jgi:hypothetical protein
MEANLLHIDEPGANPQIFTGHSRIEPLFDATTHS